MFNMFGLAHIFSLCICVPLCVVLFAASCMPYR